MFDRKKEIKTKKVIMTLDSEQFDHHDSDAQALVSSALHFQLSRNICSGDINRVCKRRRHLDLWVMRGGIHWLWHRLGLGVRV